MLCIMRIHFYTFCFPFQTQRKYELEADLRMKTEGRLREVEEQLQAEINARMQISSSSQHTNEKINQLERQVCADRCTSVTPLNATNLVIIPLLEFKQ